VIQKHFRATNPGRSGFGITPVEYNGELYTLMEQNPASEIPVITKFNPLTHQYTQVADLLLTEGLVVNSKLTVFNDKLYGVTWEGGLEGDGILFEFDPSTGLVIKHLDFNPATGTNP